MLCCRGCVLLNKASLAAPSCLLWIQSLGCSSRFCVFLRLLLLRNIHRCFQRCVEHLLYAFCCICKYLLKPSTIPSYPLDRRRNSTDVFVNLVSNFELPVVDLEQTSLEVLQQIFLNQNQSCGLTLMRSDFLNALKIQTALGL